MKRLLVRYPAVLLFLVTLTVSALNLLAICVLFFWTLVWPPQVAQAAYTGGFATQPTVGVTDVIARVTTVAGCVATLSNNGDSNAKTVFWGDSSVTATTGAPIYVGQTVTVAAPPKGLYLIAATSGSTPIRVQLGKGCT